MDNPVISQCAFCLVHVPDLVRHGSKPRRELARDPALADLIALTLRSFDEAVRYPPNQVFIGNLAPEELAVMPRPWFSATSGHSSASGPFGEIVHQDLFYALLERANVLQPPLVELIGPEATRLRNSLREHPVLGALAHRPLQPAPVHGMTRGTQDMLELRTGGDVRGLVRRDDRAEGREDENLSAHVLLEALCTKASAAIALQHLLHRSGLEAASIDYLVSCGEEATGDRYQRGGGGMAKAVGEMCGCTGASGMDVKNFCAAPANALITAGALVKAGVFERVAVLGGGSLAKLGMKFLAVLQDQAPVLEDCLGCMAFLVTRDDDVSPLLHLERGTIGTAKIGASSSEEAIYRQLLLEPLEALGLGMRDIDRYAPELHNAELMQYAGSGDVTHKNYRMIAAMAVRSGAIERGEMKQFVERIGMAGYAPPQGHIPSGVPYLGHALRAMARGELRRVMVISKASLFLNRLTALYDGVSFVVEGRAGDATAPGRSQRRLST